MRVFFDTNVLVHAVAEDEPEKGRIARNLLDRETREGNAVLSTQVLQEFFVVTTRKLERPLGLEQAERAIRDLATLPVTIIDPPLAQAAIARVRDSRLSFWDALIVQAAVTSGASKLYTEDLKHGMEIEGLAVENPFA